MTETLTDMKKKNHFTKMQICTVKDIFSCKENNFDS